MSATTPLELTVDQIAMVCHEANRNYCRAIRDKAPEPWAGASEGQRDSIRSGVKFRLANPEAPASAQHDAWMESKKEAGWTYGEEKSESNKTHPCLVPYEELPDSQRAKDDIFIALVDALGKHCLWVAPVMEEAEGEPVEGEAVKTDDNTEPAKDADKPAGDTTAKTDDKKEDGKADKPAGDTTAKKDDDKPAGDTTAKKDDDKKEDPKK